MTKKNREYQANYIAAPELAANFNVSVSTIYRWVKDGQLPAPLLIAGRTKRWRRCDVDTHSHIGNRAMDIDRDS